MKEIHIVILGRVQGVGFRYATQEAATDLNLSGWVKNRAEGGVEVLAQGPEEPLERFLKWCHEGPPLARVERVEVLYSKEVTEAPTGPFSIR